MKRLCVVRLGGMGDILLATPAVRALAQHFETDEIDFVVGKGMKDALTGIPYLREVIEFDKAGPDARLARFFPFLLTLRNRRYDLFVNFHPSAKTIAMAVASGAPRVLTFKKDRRKQPETGRVRHAVDDFSKELRPLGIPAVPDRQMDFAVPAAATARVAALLGGEFGIAPADTLLVVNPAATRDVNRWPAEKFTELLNRLAVDLPDVRVAISGGPTDLALVQAILRALREPGRVANFAGRVSIKELGALLARAHCVVTADTGPLHIASAVRAPLVCLSGAADPDRTGPLSPRDLVVINRALPCIACQSRTCARGDIACMTEMPVTWVLAAVKQRLFSSSSLFPSKARPALLSGRGEEASATGGGGL
ncbi:MAG: glycosyltransferase family 9 protein [Cytophagales bacterium]|nr:glycosyltransferase family 9 protein [Armatimonadota bacterium]